MGKFMVCATLAWALAMASVVVKLTREAINNFHVLKVAEGGK